MPIILPDFFPRDFTNKDYKGSKGTQGISIGLLWTSCDFPRLYLGIISGDLKFPGDV